MVYRKSIELATITQYARILTRKIRNDDGMEVTGPLKIQRYTIDPPEHHGEGIGGLLIRPNTQNGFSAPNRGSECWWRAGTNKRNYRGLDTLIRRFRGEVVSTQTN